MTYLAHLPLQKQSEEGGGRQSDHLLSICQSDPWAGEVITREHYISSHGGENHPTGNS